MTSSYSLSPEDKLKFLQDFDRRLKVQVRKNKEHSSSTEDQASLHVLEDQLHNL